MKRGEDKSLFLIYSKRLLIQQLNQKVFAMDNFIKTLIKYAVIEESIELLEWVD